MPVGYQNPMYGYIRIQSDAAFVAQRAFVCVQQLDAGVDTVATIDAPTWEQTGGLSFRAYDESSARWLFIANNRQLVQQDSAVPGSLFGQLPISSQGGIELPSECTFPRNGLLRIEAYAQINPENASVPVQRMFFILHGYKVFGG